MNRQFFQQTIIFFCLSIVGDGRDRPVLAADTTQMSGCEDARDRLQVRLEISQKTQEQRDAQLADVVVRYGRLELELKALKEKLAKLEPTKDRTNVGDR